MVRVPGGEVRVPVSRAADETGSLIVGVRPEKMRIAYKEEHNVNRVRGTVLDVSFTGVATSYTVETPWDPDRPVTCFELNDEGAPEIAAGDNVELVWEYAFTFGLDGDDDLDAGNELAAEAVAEAIDAEDE
jgi:spermidine/putrescine transport system ATP-binding protein